MLKKLVQIAVRVASDLMRCDGCEARAAELQELGLVADEQREQARTWAKTAIDRASQIVALTAAVQEQAEHAERFRVKWQACLKELDAKPSGKVVRCFGLTDPHTPGNRMPICPQCYDDAVERADAFAVCSRCDKPTAPPVPLCEDCETGADDA